MVVAKSKHELLKEFTHLMSERNPMQLAKDDPLEYEQEALSILSRFSESALQVPDDEKVVAEVGIVIVKQALEFWFDNLGDYDPEPLARELIAAYRAGHQPKEEVTDAQPETP